MLPSVPTRVPHGVQDGGIEPELKVAAYVAAQRAIVIEIASPQGQVETAADIQGALVPGQRPDDAPLAPRQRTLGRVRPF